MPSSLRKPGNRLRNVVVLPRDQAWSELDHGYLASETTIGLGKFKADVMITKCGGRKSTSIIELLVRYGTLSRPGTGGMVARAPTLMKI
jgi:hypothetical protein